MAEPVVDALEVIGIDQQQRARAMVRTAVLGQHAEQGFAVQPAGQRIGARALTQRRVQRGQFPMRPIKCHMGGGQLVPGTGDLLLLVKTARSRPGRR